MAVSGLKALKLVFLFSVAVSCIQLLLYRTIVLNAKHLHEESAPWKIQTYQESDIRNNSGGQNASVIVTTSRVLIKEAKQLAEDEKVQVANISRTCSSVGELTNYYRFPPITSNFSDWTFKKRRICPILNVNDRVITTRQKFFIFCENDVAYKGFQPANSSADIQKFNPGNLCLNKFIRQCCTSTLPVPNVVHYVFFNRKRLTFFEFVSFMSVLRFVRPCVILIHGNVIPSGYYWNFIINLYPNIIHVFREMKPTIFGKNVHFMEHFGDVWKIKALLRFGGIYLDKDTLLVKPVENLRRFTCTMSRQSFNKTLDSAFIMAERNATFVRSWYEGYRYYYVNTSDAYNAMVYPNILASRRPGLLHLEYRIIARPGNQFRDSMYNTNSNWSNIYGVHLFEKSFSGYSNYIDEITVLSFNSTVGAICRHILYGNKELCFSRV